jgi:hypothetical protein
MIEILEVKEGLIKCQNLTVDDANWKLYYIDYQSFTNIIRYRVHLMQKDLLKREVELSSMLFECPSCNTRFSTLEAQKLITKDMKRACPHCCPLDEISKVVSKDSFRLFEVNLKNNNLDILSLQEKFKEQLSESDDHDGIFELLAKLKDQPLLRNLPKDNIDHGLYSSIITDSDTKLEIQAVTKGKSKVAISGMESIQTDRSSDLTIEIQSDQPLNTVPGNILSVNQSLTSDLSQKREIESKMTEENISKASKTSNSIAWE